MFQAPVIATAGTTTSAEPVQASPEIPEADEPPRAAENEEVEDVSKEESSATNCDATVSSINKEGELRSLQRDTTTRHGPDDLNNNDALKPVDSCVVVAETPPLPQAHRQQTASKTEDRTPSAPTPSRKPSSNLPPPLQALTARAENPILLLLCCLVVALSQQLNPTSVASVHDFVSVLGFAVTILAIVTSLLI